MSTTAPRSSAPPAVDAQQLASEKLPSAPFPGKSEALRVFFDQSVHDAIHKHALEDTSVEICGVLVGAWRRDESGPFVHVSASIRGEAAASKNAEVTFTHDTWSKINARMDKEYADRMIVGWYHTHPNFGIFLSDRDVFIHQHFFSAPGQVAFVVDPIRKEEGVFTWKTGKPTLAAAHWVGGGQRWSPRADAPPAPAHMASARADDPVAVTPLPPPPPPPPSILSFALYAAAAAGLISAGFFLASYNQQLQQVRVAESLAQQLYNRTSSPVTRKALVEMRTLLNEIGDQTSKLTAPKKEGAEPPRLDAISAAINRRLSLAGVELNNAIEAESLTVEQQAALDLLVAQRLQATVDATIKDFVARGLLTVTKPPSTPDPAAAPGKGEAAPQAKPPAPETKLTPPSAPAPSEAPKGGK